MKNLKSFRESLECIKNLDQSLLDYYQSEYEKIKDLEKITIQVSDFSGNKTKYHSLELESLIFLIKLVEKINEKRGF